MFEMFRIKITTEIYIVLSILCKIFNFVTGRTKELQNREKNFENFLDWISNLVPAGGQTVKLMLMSLAPYERASFRIGRNPNLTEIDRVEDRWRIFE